MWNKFGWKKEWGKYNPAKKEELKDATLTVLFGRPHKWPSPDPPSDPGQNETPR